MLHDFVSFKNKLRVIKTSNEKMLNPKNNLQYRKVASSRQVYYSILNSFGQSSQYISI